VVDRARAARRKAGVDVIAVLAIGGALAMEEFVAAAIIGLMLATARRSSATPRGALTGS